MAHKLAFLFASVVLPAIVLAKDHVVGDEKGWTINFDYNSWAEGREFMVGDTLTFTYPQGVHNVVKVNASSFENCIKEPNNGIMNSGSDKITLATPGNKWYICTFGQHCASGGQKLKITVSEMAFAPGAEAPTSSAKSNTVDGLTLLFGAIFFVVLIAIN
ncbi:hypothetical protein AMTRI_Chr03g56010 [Amborella trichopoda]|uniref:basic blue protein-like n=1 Tax=Amborella trichopoda TaxID=13333 RepID=UPI0005D4045C|nr:basic blue protein-like [Amborella trichopoda]|eukprot:XP_011629126.1 basic blue protein-like [Amborella trichopoda]